MVETKNYKNNGRKYNRRGSFRNYKNSTPMKKKGLLNFLFSFNGKISKDLYIGTSFLLSVFGVLSLVIPVKPEQTVLGILVDILFVVLFVSCNAISFKRAHSLGISGIYSILGDGLFTPFFAFFKPERDFANDIMYKSRFEKLKKIGYFFNRNVITKLLFLAIIATLNIVVIVNGRNIPANSFYKFFVILFVWNVIQLYLARFNFVKKHYATVVKVLSFFVLVVLLLSIGFSIGYGTGVETVLRAIAAQQ